jgi:hypothetical protein
MYRLLVRLYPRRIRQEFGAEMAAIFGDVIHDARKEGLAAVARAWMRELRSHPAELLRAYHAEGPATAIGALVSATVAGHLITDAGLFHGATWLALIGGLAASGTLYGVGRCGQALVVAAATLGGTFTIDQTLLRAGERRTLVVPGVVYDVLADARALEALPKHTPRVRTEIHRDGVITVVRTGGVDGIYVLVSLGLLTGGAVLGRRLLPT